MRILGVIRQSRTHDQTISPAIQRNIQENWVAAKNQSSTDGTRWEIVGWAEDLDVSAGTTRPWERPALGPWLTDEKAHEWDMLLAWKLDRLCRSSLDFALLVKWLDERQKTLACTNDPIDLDSPIGRAVAAIMAILAELELENIKARAQENQRSMRTTGKWGGGRIPFARMLDPTGASKEIVIDPDMEPVFREIISDVHREDSPSLGAVATWLNQRGILTSLDRQRQLRGEPIKEESWTSANLWRILRNPHLIGHKLYKGAAIRNDDGEPVIFYEPLMKPSEWERLQTELDRRSKDSTEEARRNTMLLRKVGSCEVCGGNVHQHVRVKNNKKYPLRYRCASHTASYAGGGKRCANGTIAASAIEGALVDAIMSRVGDKPWLEKIFVPGEDHTEELTMIESAIAGVRKEKDLGLYEGDEDSYLARLSALLQRRKALLSKPSRPSGYMYQPTGVTVAQHWESLDTAGQNTLLIKWKVRVTFDTTGGFTDIKIDLGDLEQLERLAQGVTDLPVVT
ncbi:recombinase family protein [Nonomuraea zeae]|uniref:recombinase family protein n=1 Tax=Nonomuraea zeae TaxID=1642303 RepID=UPI0036D23158